MHRHVSIIAVRARTEADRHESGCCDMCGPDAVHPSVHSVIKRITDLTVAALGLIVLAPVLATVALVVYLALGRPVLFRQVRSGYRSRPFTIYKFRTMREARGIDGELLPDAERLTSLGRFLRTTSLDELPQLWNVLRGDLSLVGPRPLLIKYLLLYTPEQAHRHAVRPGITGWAQVNGRNALGWEERFRYDIWYVDHWSPRLDAWILLRTIIQVIRREEIREPIAEPVALPRSSNGEEA